MLIWQMKETSGESFLAEEGDRRSIRRALFVLYIYCERNNEEEIVKCAF